MTEQVTLISPVHQTPDVLEPVLRSWIGLLDRGVDHIILVNDHSPKESVEMMRATATVDGQDQITVVESGLDPNVTYSKSDVTHNWQPEALSRIAKLRGRLLDILGEWGAHSNAFSLMVDSDLLIRPDVVESLLKEVRARHVPWFKIVSPIFWTKWMPDQPLMPQVWDQHPYGYNGIPRQRIEELRQPGLHRVNGLGACTLLPLLFMREHFGALSLANIYAPIPGLERGFNGLEDRHFCTRMTCNGFELYGLGVGKWEGEGTRAVEVDPGVFHVYRSTDVARAWELVREWEERFK